MDGGTIASDDQFGPDEAMALATKLNLAALFMERSGKGFFERATPRFEAIAGPSSFAARPPQ
jgi:hypothetical protein